MSMSKRIKNEIEIIFLPDDKDLVQTLAQWHHDQWHHLSKRSLEDRITEFEAHFDSSEIPLTLVAMENGQPVGCASLLAYDMHTHMNLTPWLASVFVIPELRGQGLGSQLCERAVAEARKKKVETLFLYTPDRAPFYQRMGWESLETIQYAGEEVTLMKVALIYVELRK